MGKQLANYTFVYAFLQGSVFVFVLSTNATNDNKRVL